MPGDREGDGRPSPRTPAPHTTSPDLSTPAAATALAALGAARAGTVVWDVATGALTLDARALALAGHEPDGFDGRVETAVEHVHPEDRARVARALDAATGTAAPIDLELRVTTPDGAARWVQLRGTLTRDDDGEPLQVVGITLDVTVRDGSRPSALFESMPTAFYSIDREWRFTYVNTEAERLLGRPRTELIGGDLWELFPHATGSEFATEYHAAARTGRASTFEAYYPAPLDSTYEVQVWPGPDGLAVYFRDITLRRRTQDAADRERRRDALLSAVTAELSENLDAEQGVARLAELLVPTLADWCVVTLVEDENGGSRHLKDLASAHVDPDVRPLVERYAKLRIDAADATSPLFRALDQPGPVVVPSGATERLRAHLRPGEARDLVAQLAPDSVTVLSLRGRGPAVGLVTLFNQAERGPISAEDLELAQEVAERAGRALDNVRLYRRQRQLAEVLQRSMLTSPVEPDHVQVAVRYVPAAEAAQVGGDWYDAFMQRNGATVLVIGDVVGHDMTAAASMGQIRSMLRGIAVATGAGPAELLTEVDVSLATLRSDAMATAVAARIEQTDEQLERGERTLRFSRAGHLSPLLVDPDGGVHELAGSGPDLLLGVVPETVRSEATVALAAGSTLLFYTDGLVERRDRPVADGVAQLRRVLARYAGHDLESLCDDVLDAMLPPSPGDDVALVAVRLHRQDRPRPVEAGPESVPESVPDDPSAAGDRSPA